MSIYVSCVVSYTARCKLSVRQHRTDIYLFDQIISYLITFGQLSSPMCRVQQYLQGNDSPVTLEVFFKI